MLTFSETSFMVGMFCNGKIALIKKNGEFRLPSGKLNSSQIENLPSGSGVIILGDEISKCVKSLCRFEIEALEIMPAVNFVYRDEDKLNLIMLSGVWFSKLWEKGLPEGAKLYSREDCLSDNIIKLSSKTKAIIEALFKCYDAQNPYED